MKSTKTITFMVLICGLYACFLAFDKKQSMVGEPPQIEAPETVAQVSVYAQESELTEGLTASDPEDGYLTDRIFVERIDPFDENNQRTVTYGVFDKDDQVAYATRKIEYTDYTAPEITLEQPLIFDEWNYNGLNDLKECVQASSVVDGDLSGQLIVNEPVERDGLYYTTFAVVDSCGTRSNLELRVDMLETKPGMKIELTDYLIRVKPGTKIDPLSYIDNIGKMGMDYKDLKEEIDIRTDYDANTPGTYEFIYELEGSGGSFGLTKLVVVVEQE